MALVIKWKNFSMVYRLDSRSEGSNISTKSWNMIQSITAIISGDGFTIKDLEAAGNAEFNCSRTTGDQAGYTGNFLTSEHLRVNERTDSLNALAAKVKGRFPEVNSSYGVAIRIQTDSENQNDFPRDKKKLEALELNLRRALRNDFKDPHIVCIDGRENPPHIYLQIHHKDLAILDKAIELIQSEHDKVVGASLATA